MNNKELKRQLIIDTIVDHISSTIALHNKFYPDNKVTIEDVINQIKPKVKK